MFDNITRPVTCITNSENKTMAKYELDATGLLCPMPVIKTQDRVEELEEGDTLEVLCSDPGALNDVTAWCRINGHKVIDARREDSQVIIHLEVMR